MSSRTKDKVAARERVDAMRAAQARAARRRRVLLAGASIGVVVLLLVAPGRREGSGPRLR